MINIIIIAVIVIIVGLASYYIYREKKNGSKCIGCPYGKNCGSKGCNDCTCSIKQNDSE